MNQNYKTFILKKFLVIVFLGMVIWLCAIEELAAQNRAVLKNIEFHPVAKNDIQLEFVLEAATLPPTLFSVAESKTIIVDFPETESRLPKEFDQKPFAVGIVKAVKIIETSHKARVTIHLKEAATYDYSYVGNKLLLTLCAKLEPEPEPELGSEPEPSTEFEHEHENETIEVSMKSNVEPYPQPNNTVHAAESDQENLTESMRKSFIEPQSHSPLLSSSGKLGQFTGDNLSFNFQDIEIRAALQILADFAKFNLIASDGVQGNITLRLQNVPWDQALDIILKSKNLDQRKFGNVLLIGPTTEIAAREKMELESLQQVSNLEPLHSELVQVNYAKAEDLQGILKEKDNSILSHRGNVTVDKRTNMLLIQDTGQKLSEIKQLIRRLDIPVRQVEISTQIVSADNTLEEVLGMRFGGAVLERLGNRRLGVGSTVERARAISDYPGNRVPPSNASIPNSTIHGAVAGGPTVQSTEGLFSDLPAVLTGTGATGLLPGKLGFALARLPNGTLIDLELQALEFEAKVKTISRPKIITTDKTRAYVEQGFEIAYQEASASGATSTSFKRAVLRLEVTPQITPDNKVILDLMISNDTPQNITSLVQGTPGQNGSDIGLKTSRMSTQVLADDGETIVLGGVLTLFDSRRQSKIPFFGDLPLIGVIFRNKDVVQERKEVLIFITPRISKAD